MNAEITKIMEDYKNGATLEATNAALKPFGIHLDPEKNPGGGWTKEEMEQGFIPGDPANPLPDLSEFQVRVPELAGHTVEVLTKQGAYKVTYKDDGYHDRSVHL